MSLHKPATPQIRNYKYDLKRIHLWFYFSAWCGIAKFLKNLHYSESIKWQNRARLSHGRIIWLLPHPFPPLLSPLKATHRKTEKERQVADGRGGGWRRARSRIIRPQESLALYKSFNNICRSPPPVESLRGPLRMGGGGGRTFRWEPKPYKCIKEHICTY